MNKQKVHELWDKSDDRLKLKKLTSDDVSDKKRLSLKMPILDETRIFFVVCLFAVIYYFM